MLALKGLNATKASDLGVGAATGVLVLVTIKQITERASPSTEEWETGAASTADFFLFNLLNHLVSV